MFPLLLAAIQFDLGMLSQLWFVVLHFNFERGLRFCWDKKLLGGVSGFLPALPLPSKSMSSRERHSTMAVIHFEQILLSSHRYMK